MGGFQKVGSGGLAWLPPEPPPGTPLVQLHVSEGI